MIRHEAIATSAVRTSAEAASSPRRILQWEKLSPILIVSPMLVVSLIFVYGFIVTTILISLSNWSPMTPQGGLSEPLYANYQRLFGTARFQADLRNTLVFSVLFLLGSMGAGLMLAVLVDRKLPGTSFFRSVFLFPYALSFIVTGVAWRWIFNPETGVNVLIDTLGINATLEAMGFDAIKPGWLTDPTVWPNLNEALSTTLPFMDAVQVQLGIPLALVAVAIAASWQLAGFAMATYLSGLATIPAELKEAALIDNASGWTYFRRVVWPLLAPFTALNLIILGHTSLRIFDLVFAMSGSGPGFATDVPGIFVFETTFRALRYNLGAAASVVMLLLVSAIIVPYLWKSFRSASK